LVSRKLGSLCLESRLALLLGLLFGVVAIAVVPPLITFDGPGHYFRSLQVTRGEFRAVRLGDNHIGGIFTMEDVHFVKGVWITYWNRHDLGTFSSWAELSRKSALSKGVQHMDITNTAIESPVNHLVQGVGLRLAQPFSKGPLWPIRLGCLFNLLGYLAVVVATIEILPAFRRGLVLFAVSPLILVQAASLSHDAVNFSLPLLFLAVAWRLRTWTSPISHATLCWVTVLACLVALLKPVAAACLLCFLVVPTRAFGSKRRQIASLALVFGCAGALWTAWNFAYHDLDIAKAMDPSRDDAATVLHKQWVMHHPFAFFPVFVRFLMRDIWEQWPVAFGDVGGWVSSATRPVMARLSVVFILALIGAEFGCAKRDLPRSGGLLFQAFVLLFGTCFVCWFALGTIGLEVVPGLGGRYLLLVYLAFLAGVLLLLPPLPERLRILCFSAGLVANIVGLLVILIPTAVLVWG
jgi:uncharacterized membrane protein